MAPFLDASGGLEGSEPLRPTGLYVALVVTGILMFAATAITFVNVVGLVKILIVSALLISAAISGREMFRTL